MMRALVVYESMFGNTRLIAEAVADGLSRRMRADVVEVGAAPAAIRDDVALLVAGGPTHAFGMSRPGTRQDAARQTTHGLVSAGNGLREWLAALPEGSKRVAAAAFDTRIERPRLPGSAAHAAERRLRRLGFRVAAPAKCFYVAGTQGPLMDGEQWRARDWGEHLAAELAATQPAGRVT
jgi:hypothetical protein